MDSKKKEHLSQAERQVQIGSLRQIELLSRESSLQLMNDKNYKYIYTYSIALELFPNNTVWGIGFILFGYMIVCSSEGGKIYALLSAPEPICIAEDYTVLNKILDIIETCWKGKENETYLPKSEATLAMRKKALEEIVALSPNADSSVWDWIAFEELSISMS